VNILNFIKLHRLIAYFKVAARLRCNRRDAHFLNSRSKGMGRMTVIRLFLFVFLLWGSISFDLYALEDARLLPKGISRVRLAFVTTQSVDAKFNNAGQVDTLGGANQTVSLQQLMKSNKQVAALANALNALGLQAGNNLGPWNLHQDIEFQRNVYGGAYEYGISKRWNIGVRLRIEQTRIVNKFRVDENGNAQKVLNKLQKNGSPPQQIVNGLNQIGQGSSETFANSLFAANGYDLPDDFNVTAFGYTEVGAKYLVHQSENFITSTLFGVRVPTGRGGSLSNPLDRGTPENVWGAGLELFQEWAPFKYFSLIGSVRSKYFFSDTEDRAVPKSEDDALPSLLPEDGQVVAVKRQIGSIVNSEIGALVKLPGEAFSVWGAYQFYYKAADKYSGSGDLLFSKLSENSNSKSTGTEFGVGYSTIQSYRKGKFFMPMQITAQYNNILEGTNVPKVSFARIDLKVYF